MNNKKWTKWTDDVLESFMSDYKIMSWDDLLCKYPFTKSTMMTKASELGIRRMVGRMPKYTKNDDMTIRDMFMNGRSDAEIAEVLGRTGAGIETRRQRLNMTHRPGAWSADEESILTELYGLIPATSVSDLLPGRSRNAVVAHAMKLGLVGYRPYHTYTTEEESS